MRVKTRVEKAETWIDALPESLKHEFSLEELEQMKQQVRDTDLANTLCGCLHSVVSFQTLIPVETEVSLQQSLSY